MRLSSFFPQRYERGQIEPSSSIGRWIELLVLSEETQNVVEIGTWNGRGSTLCIHNGCVQSGKTALSIEASKPMWEKARKNLPRKSPVDLIWGSIVGPEDLDTEELSEEESAWLASDLAALESAPDVLRSVPEEINLLVLDGGEFASYSEFLRLESRLNGFVVLDDTKVRKNKLTEAWLESSNRWIEIVRGADRNGWSVWKSH